MALTRRLFLERLAGSTGAAMTYEAMAALGLLAIPEPARAASTDESKLVACGSGFLVLEFGF